MAASKSAAVFYTAEELNRRGSKNLPKELVSNTHLIYSSPAALAFNSPGAEGFGVKRAALSIPGSVLLLVSPGCCGRNTSLISRIPGYDNRFFYLTMSETDIVTGRHLKKIPQAIEELYASLNPKPSVVMICITCVDALLGTDMERVCRKAEEKVPVPVRPTYMYALTREGRKPPMVHVRQSLYSILMPRKKRGTTVNILGFFAPLADDCEIYPLLRSIGIRQIHEISRCRDYAEFQTMAEANFNLVLNPEARFAAEDFEKNLKIPFIELHRFYDISRIHRQYQAFGASIGVTFDDSSYYKSAEQAILRCREKYPQLIFSIGECMNADPFELAAALLRYGYGVSEIFGTVTEDNFFFVQQIAKISPSTKIYSNLEPTMIAYDSSETPCDLTVGKDAGYYHPDEPNLVWNSDVQPFGYAGVERFFEELIKILDTQADKHTNPETTNPDLKYGKFTLLPPSEQSGSTKNPAFRKYLTPFAPDQSGAVGVLYELGGIQVICDAGGCVGNICGFDEPRWFEHKSAIFSAGLRDMDAILGRDDKLTEKLADAAGKIPAEFAAIIGTPVPSVIGTDYHALKRMAEKKTGLPLLAIPTNGMELYDEGEKKAYLELFSTFTGKYSGKTEKASVRNKSEFFLPGNESASNENANAGKELETAAIEKGRIGVIGATPLNYSDIHAGTKLQDLLKSMGWTTVDTYGMSCGLDRVETADRAEKNLVVSPSGLAAAEYLKRKFGTPYEIGDPLAAGVLGKLLGDSLFGPAGKHILIIAQQVTGQTMREILLKEGAAQVTLATWFMKLPELSQPQDLRLTGEKQLQELVAKESFDLIIADPVLNQMLPEYTGQWVDLPQFAVSGQLADL